MPLPIAWSIAWSGGVEGREWIDGGARRVLALVDPVALAAARWKQKAEMDLDRSREVVAPARVGGD